VVIFVVNLVVAGVTLNKIGATKIDRLGFDVKTGTFIMSGGVIRNGSAFTAGNFVFLDPGYIDNSNPDTSYDTVVSHEIGHTLENGAFGSAFLLADFVGENLTSAGVSDYGEEIAESHSDTNNPLRPRIPMWG